jgi:hypothetical protein
MADIEMVQLPVQLSQPWLLEGLTRDDVFEAAADDPKRSVEHAFVLSVGNRPFARSLRKLYALRGEKMPPEMAALRGEVYLVTHAIGLLSRDGKQGVDALTYRASFGDPGSTVELFPNTRFKEFFSTTTQFEAGLSADGHAKLPSQIGELAADVINLGASAELHLGTKAGVVGKLSMAVKSPTIQAVGHASNEVTWQLAREDDPLLGDQILVQTVLVPRGAERLTYRIQASAVIDPGWFRSPVRIETPAIEVVVELG